MITFCIKDFLLYKDVQRFYFEAACGNIDAFWRVIDDLDAILIYNRVPRERCEWMVVPKVDYGISKIYVEFWFTEKELVEHSNTRWAEVKKEENPFSKFEQEYFL